MRSNQSKKMSNVGIKICPKKFFGNTKPKKVWVSPLLWRDETVRVQRTWWISAARFTVFFKMGRFLEFASRASNAKRQWLGETGTCPAAQTTMILFGCRSWRGLDARDASGQSRQQPVAEAQRVQSHRGSTWRVDEPRRSPPYSA